MEITRSELEQLIDRVADRTARAVVAQITRTDDRLLDRVEAAEALGISVATLDRRTQAGLVPSIMIGRLRRYRLSAILHATAADDQKEKAEWSVSRVENEARNGAGVLSSVLKAT